MSMAALLTRQRLGRLTGFASTQLAVQLIGFGVGIVLVRCMTQPQYGYYTLAISMASVANILTELGLATAVMALGGRLLGQPQALGALVSDANALHRKLAGWSFAALMPCCAWLLMRQQAPTWQVAVLTVLIIAAAALNVRVGIALSIARLSGHTALQQKLDLRINAAKLVAVLLLASVALDATVACLLNLAVAVAYFVSLRRYLAGQVEAPALATGQHLAALRRHLWQQAPNSIYFVLSSQLAVWLIGVFGSAERVAEVGALGRLGAGFAVIGSVSAALVLPYFARHDGPVELMAGFVSVNAFYAALLALLLSLATAFPATILWVLGGTYGGLQSELVWMILASTLATWSGTVYSIGCARGWVMPLWLVVSTGVAATAVAASLVDVSTVRGSFQINTAMGGVGVVAAVAYFAWKLRHHAQLKASAA
ncbi:MAG: hypothetical protein K2Q07_08480 [Burkholderiaceae bacterium]|nr:hypothetical protein [Burkholderiaceae bacterium]